MANYFELEAAKKRVHCQLPGQMFNLHIDKLWDRCPNNPARVVRITIMLEDWQPGHYAEYRDQAYVNWRAGSVIEWTYDTPHMAANLGLTPRYTLQITGHVSND